MKATSAPTVAASAPGRPSAPHICARLALRAMHERRRFIGAMALAAVAMAVMTTSLYSSVGADYNEIMDDLPAAVTSMLGAVDMATPAGWLQVELFSLVAPALVVGAAVSIGASSVAGAEQDGHLTLVTASPVPRSAVVTAGALATAAAVTLTAGALLAGIVIGAQIGGLTIGASQLVGACAALALLGVAVGFVSLAAGAATGKRSTASGVGTTVAIVSYAGYTFLPLSETLEPLSRISLWHPFASNSPLINGLDPLDAMTLAAVAAVALFAALRKFERRDLRV